MGLFSFITSDTKRSIPTPGSSRPTFPVWMLLPNGGAVYEPYYDGYGNFGDRDIYEELAKATLGARACAKYHTETVRGWGIDLFFMDDPDAPLNTRETLKAERAGTPLGDWLAKHPRAKPKIPRLVEKRVAYSSVPDITDCPNQGF